ARRVLDVFCYVVAMVVLVYLCKGGVDLTRSVTKKVTPFFKISYSYIDAAAPIGCVLMMIQYTFVIFQELFGKKETEAKGGVS
ncbi:MAG: TRAP transporter small permease subunit, partial [Oscillibacter sp.]|nr:TRAP transporter small permease subunit [Oscillibacter sp.]